MRIVSLLASATEMIAALGCLDQLVGRSHECDYPPEVQKLPVVSHVEIDVNTTSSEIDAQIKRLARQKTTPVDPALKALSIYAIDIALLQALHPDVIFTQTQCEVCAVSEHDVTQAITHLTSLYPRVVSLSPHHLEDVWHDVLRVGQSLERAEEAEQLVFGYRKELRTLQERIATSGQLKPLPRVAVLEWLDPLMGAGNWTPELVAYAGGQPVSGEIGLHSPWLSWEELHQADPDVLVLSPCGFTLERTMQDVALLQRNPQWTKLRAVQNGRVFAIDGNQYLNRSGPRLVQSAKLLARVIWGDQLVLERDASGWQHIK